MSSTTVRVDLPSAGRVDRTVPALLGKCISSRAWTAFCERLDEAMEPARRARCFFLIVFGGLFLVTILIFALSFAASFASASSGPGGGGVPIGPFVIVPIIWVATFIGVTAYVYNSSRRLREKLQRICEEETKGYSPHLSFHVKEDQGYYYHHHDHSGYGYRTSLYIEIQINAGTTITADVEAPMATAVAFEEQEIPVATVPPVESSVADHMNKLELKKHHLTPEEYEIASL